jgi:hypothetical protein
MSDRRDLIESWIGDATGLLSDALPSTFAGHIPEILAALAPSLERLISASSGTVAADRVVVRDHRSTRLAADNPAMHGDCVEAANRG